METLLELPLPYTTGSACKGRVGKNGSRSPQESSGSCGGRETEWRLRTLWRGQCTAMAAPCTCKAPPATATPGPGPDPEPGGPPSRPEAPPGAQRPEALGAAGLPTAPHVHGQGRAGRRVCRRRGLPAPLMPWRPCHQRCRYCVDRHRRERSRSGRGGCRCRGSRKVRVASPCRDSL